MTSFFLSWKNIINIRDIGITKNIVVGLSFFRYCGWLLRQGRGLKVCLFLVFGDALQKVCLTGRFVYG
jgi:hypothetical protein